MKLPITHSTLLKAIKKVWCNSLSKFSEIKSRNILQQCKSVQSSFLLLCVNRCFNGATTYSTNTETKEMAKNID